MLNNRRKVINKTLNQILFILALMLCWELLARTGWFPPLLFPRLSDVLRTLITDIRSGEIVGRLYFSLYLIAQGLALAVVTAAVAAVLPSAHNCLRLGPGCYGHPPSPTRYFCPPIIILWLGRVPLHSPGYLVLFSLATDSQPPYRTAIRSGNPDRGGQNLGLRGPPNRQVLIPSAFPISSQACGSLGPEPGRLR